MYENYTRQSLPSKEYRALLGTALCVFNSNNAFIIENILSHDENNSYSWYDLIDKTSGELSQPIKETITRASTTDIALLFQELIKKRNRIMHSFQITGPGGEQILATKDRNHNQYVITSELLMEFIKKNSELSNLLHEFRGH